jgi:anti-sigma regulatory factor (Ser/Thr protein kinase)
MRGSLTEMNLRQRFRVCLPRGNDAPARARAELRSAGAAIAGTHDTIALLVSELVTNAIKHTEADSIEVALLAAPETVRVEVAAAGPSFKAPAEPKPTAHGGFGLFLVNQLADRWGVHENDVTRVWFELAR